MDSQADLLKIFFENPSDLKNKQIHITSTPIQETIEFAVTDPYEPALFRHLKSELGMIVRSM